jgi:hypothetical protein
MVGKTMILKNKSIRVRANSFGSLFMTIYDRNDKDQLVHEAEYKFDGSMDGVDLEISIPPKCRTEYAKIMKVGSQKKLQVA